MNISNEVSIEQFLRVPSLSLYRLIDDKDVALKLLLKNRKIKDIIDDMNKCKIEFLIDICYFDDFDENLIHLAARKAAYKGYNIIVNNMIGRGANNFNLIASSAAVGGHKDIIDCQDGSRRGTQKTCNLY